MSLVLTSISAVKKLIVDLEKQGFTSHYLEYEFIRSKMDFIIKQANKLSLSVDHNNIIEKLQLKKIDAFQEMEIRVAEYFSQFSQEDKMFELMGSAYPCRIAQITVPSTHYGEYAMERYEKELIKYNIKEIPQKANGEPVAYFNVYSLMPGKKIKIALNGHTGTLKRLIQLVYGKQADIQITEYGNGNTDLKGDVEKLRQCYIKYLTTKRNYCVLITEAGTQTIK